MYKNKPPFTTIVLLISFVFISLACSSDSAKDSSDDLVITDPKDKEPEDYVSPTVVSPGEVSDISAYAAKPHYEEGAGYNGNDLANLSASQIVDFVHVDGKSDTEELEKLMVELNALGGGKITIKSGEYAFRDVNFKSNIHITIESGTVIKLEKQNEGRNLVNGYRYFFALSGSSDTDRLENVRIVGLGSYETRPKLIVERFRESWGEAFNRAITLGYVKNALVENISIEDNYTLGAAIAFNPVDYDKDEIDVKIPENVTIANVSLTKGSIGYGLVQTGVGNNLLLKNLSCEGGMTCRIETHTGRQFDLGVSNVVIKNVASINGKAAVLLQPHSVLNGRILVDKAKSEGSTWTLFLKEGFVGKDSKRREKGDFDASSEFKNISMVSTDNTATLSFKNLSFVPVGLKPLFKAPNYVLRPEDVNHKIDASTGLPGRESLIMGPSIAAIYRDASYSLNLPKERDIIITGKTEHRLKLYRR